MLTLVAPGSAQLLAGNRRIGLIALRIYLGLAALGLIVTRWDEFLARLPESGYYHTFQAMRRLAGDAALRQSIGAAGASTVAARYAVSSILKQWDDVISSPMDAEALYPAAGASI